MRQGSIPRLDVPRRLIALRSLVSLVITTRIFTLSYVESPKSQQTAKMSLAVKDSAFCPVLGTTHAGLATVGILFAGDPGVLNSGVLPLFLREICRLPPEYRHFASGQRLSKGHRQ